MNKSSKIEAAREWIKDSLHQHIDDVVKVACAALFFHGEELAAVLLAAGFMAVSLLALLFVHKAVGKVEAHKAARAPMSYNEVEFEASFIQILREHQEGR